MLNAKDYFETLETTYRESEYVLEQTLAELRRWWKFRGLNTEAIPVQGGTVSSAEYSTDNVARWATDNVRGLASGLLDRLPSDVADSLKGTVIGALPLRSINAYCVRAPAGDPLIIVDRGLMTLLHHFIESMSIAQRLVGDQETVKEGALLRLVTMRFIVNYYVSGGRMSFPMVSRGSHQDFVFATVASMASEIFVLAHEYAHIYLGHLDQTKTIDLRFASESQAIEFYQQSKEREFEADQIAWEWYTSTLDQNPLFNHLGDNAYLLPLQVFQLMALIEKSTKTVDRFSTHPPAVARLRRLVGQLPKVDFVLGVANHMVDTCETMFSSFSTMSEESTRKLDLFIQSLETSPDETITQDEEQHGDDVVEFPPGFLFKPN